MLSKFNKSVIIFFCVLFIIISLIFFQNYKYLLANTAFPNYINKCPDHWEYIDSSDNKHKCASNRLNNGTPDVGPQILTIDNNNINVANSKYDLDNSFNFKNVYKKNNYCALYEYSKKKSLQWSGITNANYTKYC